MLKHCSDSQSSHGSSRCTTQRNRKLSRLDAANTSGHARSDPAGARGARVGVHRAHPDDEASTLLLTSRMDWVRAHPAQLNRGEGGQNGHGPEQGQQLASYVARSFLPRERRRAHLYFHTRVVISGFFRKTLKEHLRCGRAGAGGHVRVIRTVRPKLW